MRHFVDSLSLERCKGVYISCRPRLMQQHNYLLAKRPVLMRPRTGFRKIHTFPPRPPSSMERALSFDRWWKQSSWHRRAGVSLACSTCEKTIEVDEKSELATRKLANYKIGDRRNWGWIALELLSGQRFHYWREVLLEETRILTQVFARGAINASYRFFSNF